MKVDITQKDLRESSFTLIEIIIVTSILAVLVGFSFVELSAFKNRHNFDLDAENIVDAIQNAQSKSVQQEGGSSWGILFINGTSTDTYQIFRGASYSNSSVTTAGQLSSATVYNNPMSGSSSSVVFAERTGLPTSGNSTVITLDQNGGNGIYTVSISSAGRISKNPESGLVGYWPMDEGSGNYAYNVSGSIQTGTLTGKPTWQSSCRVNVCLNFNSASSTYVYSTPSTSLSGSFTVMAWGKPSSAATMDLVGTRGPSDYSFDMKFMGGNKIHSDIGNGATSWITTAADANFTYSAGQWYHVAYVVTPTSYTIYVNGNQVSSSTYASNTPLLYNPTHYIYIGQSGGGNEFFNGNIDDVRIYSRALSATEILNLYNSY